MLDMTTMPRGLSAREAAERLRQYGPNKITAEQHLPGVKAFLERFRNPLIIILLAAAVASALLGDTLTFIIISVIVALSVLLDFINTYRSQKAAKELGDRVRVKAVVWRDGRQETILLARVVPGDIIELEAGKVVPADGKVLNAKDLYVNESALTGESFPQPKTPDAPLYMGSSVTSGEAIMQVTSTGKQTQFSKIAESLMQSLPTEFDRELSQFSLLIVRLTGILVALIFIINILFHHTFLGSLLFSLALAVGLTPSLLPLLMTLNLTKGSLKMAREGVIVKKLSAIQNFGSMDVLCTDKTGTLTEDRITLVKYLDGNGQQSDEVLLQAYLTSVYTSAFESPMDRAVKSFRHLSTEGYKKLDEVPFTFERKRESAVVRHDGKIMLITKGAPETVLQICTSLADGRAWSPSVARKINAQYIALSQDGFRVLAIASKMTSKTKNVEATDETDMVFQGFVAFLDPAKKSAGDALRKMQKYGVQVKIISGDNLLVNLRIAADIKLKVVGTLTGDEIEKLNDLELMQRAEKTTIFARVNPEQKLRIIQLLQRNEHVVGYLGDGINDAPSLKAADIGISVNNAVDVAKGAADLILLHKSLGELIEGVIEGRRTFANTMKYLMMSLSSNFGNMFSMAGASLFLPFLPMLAPQILLNNLLYDASQFALPVDKVDDDLVARPHRLSLKGIKRFMLIFGPLSSLFDFATFGVLLLAFHLPEGSFQAGWFLESILTQIFVVYIVRTRHIPFVQSWPSWPLILSTLSAAVIAGAVIFTSLGAFFHFGELQPAVAWKIGAIVAIYLVAAQFVKVQFYKRTTIV